MKKIFCIAFLFLAGCSSLEIVQPYGMMEIPEVTDAGPARSFDYGFMPALEFSATSDASYRPLRWDPSVRKSTSGYVRLRLPVRDTGVEFAVGTMTTLGIVGNFKYQFMGQPLSKAKKGDWSLASVVQLTGGSTSHKSGDQNGTFGSGGNRWEGEMTAGQAAVSVIGGWRPSDLVLLYAGPYYSGTSVKANVDQKVSDDGRDPGGKYEYTDRVVRYGPMLGVFWKPLRAMSIQAEAYHLTTSFKENLSHDPEVVGAIGMRFDFF